MPITQTKNGLQLGSQKEIFNVLYLDDEAGDLKNFLTKANSYNRDIVNENKELFVIPVKNYDEFMDIIENQSVHTKNKLELDIVICDQNIPFKWNGINLLVHTRKIYPNPLYAIYTGASSPSGDLKVNCKKENILYLEKTDEFSTTIEKIFLKLPDFDSRVSLFNPDDPLYKIIITDIIDDMKNIEKKDESFKIVIAERQLNPTELIFHILKRTKIGNMFVEDYTEGLKFFKNK